MKEVVLFSYDTIKGVGKLIWWTQTVLAVVAGLLFVPFLFVYIILALMGVMS